MMSKGYDNIDRLFKEEFNNFSPEVPDGIWENIAGEIMQPSKRRLLFMPFVKYAAAIALLIVTVGLSITLLNKRNKAETVTLTAQNTQPAIDDEGAILEGDIQSNALQVSPNVQSVIRSETKDNPQSLSGLGDESIIDKKSENVPGNNLFAEVSPIQNKVESNNVEVVDPVINMLRIDIPDFSMDIPENMEGDFSSINTIDIHGSTLIKSKKDIDIMIGGYAGPQVAYRNLQPESMSADDYNFINESDGMLVSYTGGVNIEVKAGRRFSVQSGIYYSKMGMTKSVELEYYQTEYNGSSPDRTFGMIAETQSATNTSVNIINATGIIGGGSNNLAVIPGDANYFEDVSRFEEMSMKDYQTAFQYFELVEIPVMARYYLVDRKLKFNILGGVSANILVNSPVYLDDGAIFQETTRGLNKYNYSGTFGLGVGYLLNNHIRFSLEPQFKYFLNQIDKTPLADTYLYSLGIISGITYLF